MPCRPLVRVCLVAAATLGLTANSTPPAQGAFPSAVNSQITDSVSQVNVKLLGDSPAIAMGNLYLATAQALANAARISTTTQQAYITPNAATTAGVSTLLTVDTATAAAANLKLFGLPATGVQAAAIPAEGFLAGATALAFDNDGVPGAEPDFWVVADEGFDFFRGRSGNLVLVPAKIRTVGNAPSPIVDLTISIPASSVDQFFPDIFDVPGNIPPGPQAAPPLDPFQFYFGVLDANGEFGYFGSYLTSVPEPGALGMALATSVCGLLWRKRVA